MLKKQFEGFFSPQRHFYGSTYQSGPFAAITAISTQFFRFDHNSGKMDGVSF
jgi:hypothetical protein